MSAALQDHQKQDFLERFQDSEHLRHFSIYGFSLVNSTMDIAQDLIQAPDSHPSALLFGQAVGSQKTLIFSLEQSQGRGQKQRDWYSAPDTGLYMTLLLRDSRMQVSSCQTIPLVVGIAIKRYLEEQGIASLVKWPNDVLIAESGEHKKLAGVLVESSSEGNTLGSVSIGVGINLNQESFPPNVPGISLKQIKGQKVDYFTQLLLVATLIENCIEQMITEGFSAMRSEWLSAAAFLDSTVEIETGNAGKASLILRGIAEDGALIVEDPQKLGETFKIYSGEVYASSN